MELSLSTCWNASRHREGKAMLEEIREMGFQSVELGHNLRFSLWPGVVKGVNEGIVKVRSLHNFCPVPIEITRPSPDCYEFTASRQEERKAAVRATLNTLKWAAEIGAEAVVLHLGSYRRQSQISSRLLHAWKTRSLFSKRTMASKIAYLLQRKKALPVIQDRLRESLDPILQKAAELQIKLGAEFRSSLEDFPHADDFQWLFREFEGSPLGYWHDFGHAAQIETLGMIDHEKFLKDQSTRIIGAHLQDFSPPDIDHLPLGEGSLPLDRLHALLPPHTITVLELSPRAPRDQIIENLIEWKI